MIYVEGTYVTETKDVVLAKVNRARKVQKNTTVKSDKTGDKNIGVLYSNNLTWIAEVRAAELSVRESSERPDGRDFTTCQYEGVTSSYEIVYHGTNDIAAAVAAILAEDYNALLNTKYTRMGYTGYTSSTTGESMVVIELSSDDVDEDASLQKKACTGTYKTAVMIQRWQMSDLRLVGDQVYLRDAYADATYDIYVNAGSTTTVEAYLDVELFMDEPNITDSTHYNCVEYKKNPVKSINVTEYVNWYVGDVDATGIADQVGTYGNGTMATIKGLKAGNTTLAANLTWNGITEKYSKKDVVIYAFANVHVGTNGTYTSMGQTTVAAETTPDANAVEVGDFYTIGGITYKVTNASAKKVQVAASDGSDKVVTIPAYVTIDGEKYTVTAIKAGAFKGDTTVKKVYIGKNVKSIGKNAFKGCTSLKKVVVNGSSLTKVGKNAFAGINSKAVFKLADSSKASLFTSAAGVTSTMTIK